MRPTIEPETNDQENLPVPPQSGDALMDTEGSSNGILCVFILCFATSTQFET